MLLAILLCSAFAFDNLDRGSLGFLLAAVILVVVGLLDDRCGLPWWLRMLFQITAALVMNQVGNIRIENLGHMFGMEITSLGAWSTPFTVFATVGAINAVNMIDGIDGLAGLLVLSCLIMLDIEAIQIGNISAYAHMPIMIGAVAGFIVLNMRWPGLQQVSVFMGNSGSALLGLVIAYFVIRLTQDPHHQMDRVLALWVLPVPLVDCLVLMLRRIRHGDSPFSSDQNHVHHLMREAGFDPTRSALVLAMFSFVCWMAVRVALHAGVAPIVPFGAFLCLCVLWYGITSRRERAVGIFRVLRAPLGGAIHRAETRSSG